MSSPAQCDRSTLAVQQLTAVDIDRQLNSRQQRTTQ